MGCRSKLKFGALQDQRRGFGSAGNPAPLGGLVSVNVRARGSTPASTCIACGGIWGRQYGLTGTVCGEPVCNHCQVALPREALLKAVQVKQNQRRQRGHGPGCGCPVCVAQSNHLRLVSQFRSPSHHMAVATGGFVSASHLPINVGPSGLYASGGVIHPPAPPPKQEPFSMENPDADRAPDLIEPVLAWRGWNITPDGHLVAASTDGIWDGGPNKAVCRGGPNHTDVPAEGCNCGFYGWHETKDIAHGIIWGGINCWGEIIVHDCGVRAEYAEIVVLLESPGVAEPIPAELLARVVDRYKVPVVSTLAEAEKVAAGEGILTPPELRPKNPGASMEDTTNLLTRMVSQGYSPAEAAAMIQRAGAPAPGTMRSLNRSMAAISQSMAAINTNAGVSGAQLEGWVKAAMPKPSRPGPGVRFALGLMIALALDVGFGLMHRFGLPWWTGFVWCFAAASVGFWSPLPDKIWRVWRWMRDEETLDLVLLALVSITTVLGIGMFIYAVWVLLSLVGVPPPPGVVDR